MNRRAFSLTSVLTGLFAAGAAPAGIAKAAEEVAAGTRSAGKHRLVIQVSTDDRKVQATALGNAGNYAAYYQAKGEPFAIEVVAFGGGYAMVRGDTSTVKGDIEHLQQVLGNTITFSACQNSRRGIAEREGKIPDQIPQLAGVVDTAAGIVRVAELQEQGWSYARP